MKLPGSIRERFQAYGRQGGRERAARMSPELRKAVARNAAIRRWTKVRFGVSSFALSGLPGGDAIDAGLVDLAAGRESVESLVVSLAAPRLRREGVPVPRNPIADANSRLYRLLEKSDGELAHARYNAWLRQAASFADACAGVRIDG
ncbi:MAG TPA: hypothetical protein DIC52_17625 [Candidatus Latescibacteria bacterium]|jgi:hypothetical protein|nr:hypothetical protein [Candidatus Latescibacterota bacterium]|tara:strand:+ start:598 stop:1038 length:441 start_codon:yes stop_codon:yes gene_type:complete